VRRRSAAVKPLLRRGQALRVDGPLHGVTELVDPGVAATLSAHRSVKTDLNDLKLGQGVIFDQLLELRAQVDDFTVGRRESELDDRDLTRLPLYVAASIEAAHAKGANVAPLLSWLLDADRVGSNIRLLVDDPPSWLSSGHLWAAVAFLAGALAENAAATSAFQRAAELLPTRRSELLARAALAAVRGDEFDHAQTLLARASMGASEADALFINVVDAAIRDDVDAVEERAPRALERTIPDPTLVRAWLGWAKAQRNDLDGAVSVFESGLDEGWSHAGFLSSYAEVLLRRSFGSTGSSRISDAQKALDLAVRSRDVRRGWGGNSVEPVLIACQAAFSLERYSELVTLGSHTEGDATELEAGHPEIRQMVAVARLIEGGQAPEPSSPFEQAWFLGLSLSRDSATRDQAITQFERAASLASSEAELDRAQRSLANVGHVTIPRLDEVRERDPDHAEVLLAIAETNAGSLESAVSRLRPLVGRDRLAVLQLSETYVRQDRVNDAAVLLRQGGERFGEPRLMLEAARLYLKLHNVDDSELCLSLALSLIPSPSSLRREARWLGVEIAVERRDASRLEAAASLAIADGVDDPSIRWVRAEALTKLHRLREAWSEIRRNPPLVPDTEDRARFFMQLLMRREPSRLDLLAGVLDRFRDSHDVHAIGVSLFFAVDAPEPRDADAVAAMQAHVARYVEMYPESPIFRSVDVNVDDPDVFREQMRQMLNPDPERDRHQRRLIEQAISGQLPIGFVASLFGRTYLDVLLSGTAVGFACIPADAVVVEQEVDIASQHVDRAVVIDISSLVTLSFCPELWPTIVASFSSVSIPDAAFVEIDDSILRKAPAGSFQWDYEHDTWTIQEVSPEQLESLRQQRDRLRAWTSELPVVTTGRLADVPGFEELAIDNNWPAGLATAAARSSALLCDDVALAALARSIGVPAFGSFALTVALARTGRLNSTNLDRLLRALFQAQADDLPLTPAQLAGLARSLSWPPGPSLHPMSRPHYWRDQDAAHAAFTMTIQGLGANSDTASNALYAASVGVIRTVAVGSPLPLIAGLFVAAAVGIEATPPDVPPLIAAVRRACSNYDLVDPFGACVRALLEVARTEDDAATSARTVTTLFSGMEPEDRARAAAIVLGLPDA
jgi:tetratricopeptide (TPR) repeat protein